jgi:hypothetical protein
VTAAPLASTASAGPLAGPVAALRLCRVPRLRVRTQSIPAPTQVLAGTRVDVGLRGQRVRRQRRR